MRFDQLPVLETERLILRPVTIQDVSDIFLYAQDPEVSKQLAWEPSASVEETQELVERWIENYQKNEEAPWGIVDKVTSTVIGSIDVRNYDEENRCAELGYCLSRDYWGKGLMGEALKSVIRYLFAKTDITQIAAFVRIDNLQSQHVLEKVGMHKDQSAAKQESMKGKLVSLDRWVIYK